MDIVCRFSKIFTWPRTKTNPVALCCLVFHNCFAHFTILGLKHIYLHDNPWKCDCNINSLVQYIDQKQLNRAPLEKLWCVSPEEHWGKPMHTLKPESLRCDA